MAKVIKAEVMESKTPKVETKSRTFYDVYFWDTCYENWSILKGYCSSLREASRLAKGEDNPTHIVKVELPAI